MGGVNALRDELDEKPASQLDYIPHTHTHTLKDAPNHLLMTDH